MSNNSFFEVFTEGDKPFVIDTSKYVQGRSGRTLPQSLTFTLLGYRYRPSTPCCALFPPRLILSAQNVFDTSGQVVINEVGSRRSGASVALYGRISDSSASCVDSELAGYQFIIDVQDAGSFPSSIVVSIADGSILPNIIGYTDTIPAVPIVSTTDISIKNLMNNALINKTYGQLNAVSLPIGLSKSFFLPSTSIALHEEMYGGTTTEDAFVATHIHTLSVPITATSLVSRTPLFIARTSTTPINWANGGVAYGVIFGGSGTTWVNDLMQKGVVLSFFYQIDSPLRIQRFDILVGDLISPPPPLTPANETYYPTTLVPDLYREFVSVYKLYVLPNSETLTTPATPTNSVITNSAVLPCRRNEDSAFAGTFSLTFDY